ncbi:DLW-39 family protein [Intrasporangium chromatireducens]|uniref:DLW-39 family protein n=1 Tax=Intrasporangium chromatireducens TaxID=1386088 RepID=UPI0004B23E52|nr:DLW-39 family protein [Intrasporangium chromatireducens]
MWKRLVLVAASIAGVSYLRKKAKDQQAEQDLWAQATDTVPPATPQVPTTSA